jgi:hypothetical protein
LLAKKKSNEIIDPIVKNCSKCSDSGRQVFGNRTVRPGTNCWQKTGNASFEGTYVRAPRLKSFILIRWLDSAGEKTGAAKPRRPPFMSQIDYIFLISAGCIFPIKQAIEKAL